MVSGVKRRTQVEEDEDDSLAVVDGIQQVVGDSDECSLGTVLGMVHRLHPLLHPLFLDVLQ